NRDAAGLGKVLLGDGAGGDAHRGFPGRRSAAAPVVAHAVLLLVGVVGVTGPEAVADLAVVSRTLVDVVDQEPNRRARGAPLEHPGENLDPVVLAALGGEARAAGLASVEILLKVRGIERQPRRTTVDDAADSRPVALAESGQREAAADGVTRHRGSPRAGNGAGSGAAARHGLG